MARGITLSDLPIVESSSDEAGIVSISGSPSYTTSSGNSLSVEPIVVGSLPENLSYDTDNSVTAITVEKETEYTNALSAVSITTISNEEDNDYAARIDDIGGGVLYVGKAAVGANENDSVWQIKRVTEDADGDLTVEFANGKTNFNAVWDDRASLSYL